VTLFTNIYLAKVPCSDLSRDSVVGISTGYGVDGSGFETWHGQVISLFSKTIGPDLKPSQPSLQWVLGVKLLQDDVNHLLPSNAEFSGATSLFPLQALMVWTRKTLLFSDISRTEIPLWVSSVSQGKSRERYLSSVSAVTRLNIGRRVKGDSIPGRRVPGHSILTGPST
jgi:hypothetical protein